MFNFFKSKTKITESTLQLYNINILNYNLLKIDKSIILATTGSGIFYKGTYNNEPCSIKVIDNKNSPPSIINEFIYWDLYKNNKNFLHLKGAILNSNKIYLIFEFIAFTLETALNQNLITEKNRDNLIKQILYIIGTLQTEEKIISDIRPGIFGINEELIVKFLDFGIQITPEKLINNDLILNERIKYQPPEYFNFNGEDLNYDLWSFGCILIDFYSDDKIYDKKINFDEIKNLIFQGKFPQISNEINPLLLNIIYRCLERNYEKRIKIDELVNNMKIFFEENENFNVDFENFPKLKNYYFLCEKIDDEMFNTSMNINSNFFYEINYMIESINEFEKMCLNKLNENYKILLKSFEKQFEFNKEIINLFKERMLNKILIMKEYFNVALKEINKTKKKSDEIKKGIFSLIKFQNLENYKNFNEIYENSIEIIKNNVQQFSEQKPFDKIIKNFNENCNLVNYFKEIMLNNEIISCQNLLNLIEANSKIFINDDYVKFVGNNLGLLEEFYQMSKKKNEPFNRNKINDFIIKTQDNSNFIIIFDMYDKRIYNIKNPINKNFNIKSFSFYDKNDKINYISGGLDDSNNKFSYSKNFIGIKVEKQNGEYNINIKELSKMLISHASHCMLKYNKFLFVISGSNTNKNEIYNINNNNWILLPDLPNKIPNSNGAIFNGEIYIFSDNEYNIIFKLNLKNLEFYISNTLKNLDKIYFEEDENLINNNNNFENNYYDYNNNGLISWEKIEYNINNGKLHRGMGIISLGTNIFLFGGFDHQNLFNDFYIITFKDKGFFKDINNNNNIKKNVKEKIINLKNDFKEKTNEIYNQFVEGLKMAKNEYENNDNNIINNESLNEIDNNVKNNLINNENNNNFDNNLNNNLNNNNFEEDKINIIKQKIDLPCQTFFNSNIVSYEKNNLIVMLDSNNNAIEYDIKLKQFYYYFS